MICAPPFFTAEISSIGRFDTQSLPQQTLMEILVENLTDVGIAKDASGCFIDIKGWSILSFDVEDNVTEIRMDADNAEMRFDFFDDVKIPRSIASGCFEEGGSIDLRFTPSTVHSLSISFMGFTGTLETQTLPHGLTELLINANQFFGPFDIKGLPPGMQEAHIQKNHFEGALLVEYLPEQISIFNASANRFHGTVNLTKLPHGIEELYLSMNTFHGDIRLSNIPSALRKVRLHGNDFTFADIIGGTKRLNVILDASLRGNVLDGSGEACMLAGIQFDESNISEESEESEFHAGANLFDFDS